MSARPSTTATWATTTNYATSNDPAAVGQPTKNDPASIEAQGWDYASRPDPTFFNHWMNRVGDWIGWVKDNAFGADGGIYTLEANLELRGAFDLRVANSCSLVVRPTGKFYQQGEGHLVNGSTTTVESGATLTIQNGVTFNGEVSFSGTGWTWAAPVYNEATIKNQGTGHILIRPFALNTSGSQTVGINNGDEFSVPNLSGGLTITLDPTGAATGCKVKFTAWENSSAFTADVTLAEGTYSLRAAAGFPAALEAIFRGGAWHLSDLTEVT